MKLNKDLYKEYKKYPEKVLQYGEGNFLRAFVDWQINEMNKAGVFNGSAAVVQPIEFGMIDKLNDQDGLYTLYLQGMKDGKIIEESSIINSISRGINPFTHYDEYISLAHSPELRFVISNTTEAGISFDEKDKLDDKPQNSFPGKLCAFLFQRFEAFNGQKDKGLIILPCELIDRNGEKLKKIVLQYANLWNLGEAFIAWINEANIFCCTLVDRIVSGYPKDTIKQMTEKLGYEDELINVGEYFHLWVIEGPSWIENEFPACKAGLNVKFVEDMTPYRVRKVRILNGAHTALVPVAYLYGVDTVGEAVDHPIVGRFIRELIYNEIIPTLDLSEEELKYYSEVVLERFMNPFVKHYLMSIALNSVSKYETRDLPSLLEYVKRKGELPRKLVFSLAALMEFYKGKRGDETISLSDSSDILELYKKLWDNWDGTENGLKSLAAAVLGYEKNWKMDLNQVPGLTDQVAAYLSRIEKIGMVEAVKELI